MLSDSNDGQKTCSLPNMIIYIPSLVFFRYIYFNFFSLYPWYANKSLKSKEIRFFWFVLFDPNHSIQNYLRPHCNILFCNFNKTSMQFWPSVFFKNSEKFNNSKIIAIHACSYSTIMQKLSVCFYFLYLFEHMALKANKTRKAR